MEQQFGLGSRPVRAALYCRCSTPEQRVDLQLDGLRTLAKQRGWAVVGEFVDHGWSGASSKRPQLEALMKEVARGHVDALGVWRLDRLARGTRELLTVIEELRVRRVEIVSCQEAIDTSSPSGMMFITVVGLMGTMEREWLRDRTRAGMAAARKRGAIIGRPRVTVDVVRARELMLGGMSVRKAALALGIGASTLARALKSQLDSTSAIVRSPIGSSGEPIVAA